MRGIYNNNTEHENSFNKIIIKTKHLILISKYKFKLYKRY